MSIEEIAEIKELLDYTIDAELNCADGDVFSVSIGGKCINITPNYDPVAGYAWLEYEVVSEDP